jgi:hypothetical protein
MNNDSIYQIKATLIGTKPPIWRRLLVPADFTLGQLHDALQVAMGWENRHLHEFRIGGQRFGVPDPDDRLMGGPDRVDEGKVRLSQVSNKVGATAQYLYDFGDNWEHTITVEKILTPEASLVYPTCTDGKFHGPPEDCGGIGGFYNFLEAIHDPNHDEHEEMLEWGGGSFDRESFSLDGVNQGLSRKFRPSRKATRKRVASESTTR